MVPNAMTPHPPAAPTSNPYDVALHLAIAKADAEDAAARDKQLRRDLGHVIRRGATLPVPSPYDDGFELAVVSGTKPKPVAEITDPAAFTAWMVKHHDDLCRDDVQLADGYTLAHVYDALRSVAATVADELFTVSRVPADYAQAEVLKLTVAQGEPVGPEGEMGEHAPPGVAVRTPPSSIQVRLASDALEHLAAARRSPADLTRTAA